MKKMLTGLVAGVLALAGLSAAPASAATTQHARYLVTYGWNGNQDTPAASFGVYRRAGVAEHRFNEDAQFFVAHPNFVHDMYLVRVAPNGDAFVVRHIEFRP